MMPGCAGLRRLRPLGFVVLLLTGLLGPALPASAADFCAVPIDYDPINPGDPPLPGDPNDPGNPGDTGDPDPCPDGGSDGSPPGESGIPGNSFSIRANAPAAGTGNPIHLISGNKYKQQVDIAPSPGTLALEFVRHYNSQMPINRGVGVGWSHSFSAQLQLIGGLPPLEHLELLLLQDDGRQLKFRRSETGSEAPFTTLAPQDGVIIAREGGYSWHWPDGREFRFDERGLLDSIRQGGRRLDIRRRGDGRLFSITDTRGRRLSFLWEAGFLAQVTGPDGVATRYRYSREGQLLQVLRPDGAVRKYRYLSPRSNSLLTGIEDERGVVIEEYRYDDSGRAIYSARAGGVEAVEVRYGVAVDGIRETTVTNGAGAETVHVIERLPARGFPQGLDRVVEVRGPGCTACAASDVRYEYNDRLQVVRETRKAGDVREFRYDDAGRTKGVYAGVAGEPLRALVEYTYSADSPLPTSIHRPSVAPDRDHRVELTYNASGLVTRMRELGFAPVTPLNEGQPGIVNGYLPIEREVRFDYDQQDNLLVIDGARKDVEDKIRFSYDSDNRLTSVATPAGLEQRILSYDDHGRPTSMQAADRPVMQLAYDHAGRTIRAEMGNLIVNYERDAAGNLTAIVDPFGKRSEIRYDAAARAVAVENAEGPTIELSYSDEDQLTGRSVRNGGGQVIESVRYLYDAQRRLTEVVEQHQEQTRSQSFRYDDAGQLVEIEDDSGGITRLTHARLDGFLSLARSGEGLVESVTRVHLNEDGKQVGITDANGHSTLEKRDDFDRLVELTSPDTGTTWFAYDKAGNEIARRTAAGGTSEREFDGANRLIAHRTADDERLFTYHPTNGRMASISNRTSVERFVYDDQAQLIIHERAFDDLKLTTGYEYDALGRVSARILPDGQTLRYHYYGDGVQQGDLRAITRDEFFGFRQTELIGELDSNEWDGETSIRFGNGRKTTHSYDDRGRIERMRTEATLDLRYQYDAAGNITALEDGTGRTDYYYDPYDRLAAAISPGGREIRYAYDGVGNRTTKRVLDPASANAVGERQTTYAYEESGNRLSAVDGATVAYNAQGSALVQSTRVGDLRYEYNADQRPIRLFVDGALRAEYAYNGFGERVRKTLYEDGAVVDTTYYLYDGSHLSAEVAADGTVRHQYVYHDAQPVLKFQGDDVFYIHTDHSGTPRVVTDERGVTVWKARYAPFGLAEVEAQGFELNLRFPGQYADAESGTHYNYFRDYNPETGRYQTSDPLGLEGGLNTFAYAGGNPLSFIDPLGLDHHTIPVEGYGDKPLAETTFEERLRFVLEQALETATGDARQALQDMIDNLDTLALMMAGLLALQAVPGLNVVVNTVLLGWAWWHFGNAAVEFLLATIDVGVVLVGATSVAALCAAAQRFGRATVAVGVAAMDIVSPGAGRVARLRNEHGVVDGAAPPRVGGAPPPGYAVELPPGRGYRSQPNGDVIGPRGGVYTNTTRSTEDGYRIFENNGSYYVFRDGVRERVSSPNLVRNHVTGLHGERVVDADLTANGWTRMGRTQNHDTDFNTALEGYGGQQGIDGLYVRVVNGRTEYLIVEVKASINGTAGRLETTGQPPNEAVQLSDTWLLDRIGSSGLSDTDAAAFRDAIISGDVIRVKADVTNVVPGADGVAPTGNSTPAYTLINPDGAGQVGTGGVWNPAE